jgi:branched-chain amino acid transport system ATP-binding protein
VPIEAEDPHPPAVLRVRGLQAHYGESKVLHGIDFEVFAGEVVTLLGRNGAGRTTTLKSIMGLVPKRQGSIQIHGHESLTLAPHQIARLGLGFCPEERGIFSSLTCEENLLLPPILKPGGMTLQAIYDLFPNLLERRHSAGTKLSGGEQQMLALARILRSGAKLLLLDEISEGLAPVIVQSLAKLISRLKTSGFTLVMVEQNFRFAAPLADRFYVMDRGQIVQSFEHSELEQVGPQLKEFLGV